MKLGDRFEEAFSYALRIHQNDARKGKTAPYLAHLLSVCGLVLENGGDEDEAIAALLHDSIEDHPREVTAEVLESRFGPVVREIIVSCTDTPPDYKGGPKGPWRDRKSAYVEQLRRSSKGARLVAAADKVANLRDLVSDLRLSGGGVWARFRAGPEDQLWYYGAVLEALSEGSQRSALLSEYGRLVDELRKLMPSVPGAWHPANP